MTRLILVGAISTATIGGVAAAPASAAAFNCPDRSICVWTGGLFTGSRWVKSGYTQYSDVPSWLHDTGSSWGSTDHGQVECIWDHINGVTVRLDQLYPGERVAVVPNGTNDRIDAAGWC